VPAAQRIAVKVAMPAFARILKLAMRLGPETYEKCVARIDGELEFVAQLRSDGRTYLVGDAFSAADLTFAALIGSAVRAPGYGGSRFTFPEPRGELAAQGAAWRDTPAGNYAYEIYRDWR
jgi:glutathione S-transferase